MTKQKSRGRHSPSPISLRLTSEERQILKQAAKGKNLSAYIRSRLFGNQSPETTTDTERLSPQIRQKLLAKILSEFGKSGLGKSLEDIATAAKIGVLPLTPEILSDITKACILVTEIRTLLLRALGLKIKEQNDYQSQSKRRRGSTRQAFNKHARQ